VKRFEDPAEVLLFLRILAFAAAVPALKRLPLAKLQRVLEPRSAPQAAQAGARERVVRNVERALARGRPLVRPGCMTRAITLYYFLRRAGEDLQLCVGMGRVGGDYAGHAWLAKGGEPFLEKTDPRGHFVEMYRIPRPAR
jgi:hypothetical protein